jgi:hypothetical protein
MSAAIYPSKKRLSDLKTNILRTAQTSHFQAWFTPPVPVRNWMSQKSAAGIGKKFTNAKDEFYSLMCSDATLPGSTLATHEQVNDFTGVTERHAYRRQYDERSEFSFYVDREYDVITFFENWMSFIVNEQLVQGLEDTNYSYRVKFPKEYQTKIFINKFEKDYTGRMLTYQFINAFPLSINSIPVSYNASEILRVTVSFSYSRYIVGSRTKPIIDSQREFEQNLNNATNSRIPGTTDFGLSGTATGAELIQINTQPGALGDFVQT